LDRVEGQGHEVLAGQVPAVLRLNEATWEIGVLAVEGGILEERLRNRKSDREDEIKKRMQRARDEMRDFGLYDYVIVNRDFSRALIEIRSVIVAEHCRTRLIDPVWMQGLLS